MKRKLARLALSVAVGMALFAPGAGGFAAPARQSAECTRIGTLLDGRALWAGDCGPLSTPEPSSTPTDTALPPDTETPPPSDTPVPPEPSATPAGEVAPYPEAPLCASHDNRAWHGLWDAARGCHYDHHHGDDPHQLDYVFGTDIYGLMGGEISYPWQTYNAETGQLENDAKHAGYIWHVRRIDSCDASPCITAFRVLLHQHATDRDATVRYHSYVVEYATSDGGYFLMGGWADFGDLHSPEGTIIIDVPDNHDSYACGGAGRHKQHNPQPGGAGSDRVGNVWYGASQRVVGECAPRGFVTISATVHDPWDYTDPADPARFDDYYCYGIVDPGRCRINGTVYRPHLIGLNMVDEWNGLIDPDGDGQADWQGSADRYGRLLPAPCAELGTDCAPVIMRGLSLGTNYYAPDAITAQSFRDYDVYFGRASSGWNQPVP